MITKIKDSKNKKINSGNIIARRRLKALKVPVIFAQKAKVFLKEKDFLFSNYSPFSKNGFFYLPLNSNFKQNLKIPFEHVFSSIFFSQKNFQSAMPIKKLLEKNLTPKQIDLVHSAYDLIGDIAIIGIPEKLKPESKTIAQALLKNNPRIKVVVEKGKFDGDYRIRKLKILAGEKRTSTTHKENGCVFDLDLSKVYFSSRLSFERQRICNLVKPEEKVMVVFAGVGPFAIEIAKNIKSKKQTCQIVAVEWNPDACKFLNTNILKNKVPEFVSLESADANKVLEESKYSKWADRVIMPLLHQSISFIPKALKVCKENSVIHTYAIINGKEQNELDKKSKEIVQLAKKHHRLVKIISSKYYGAYSAKTNQASFDILVLD